MSSRDALSSLATAKSLAGLSSYEFAAKDYVELAEKLHSIGVKIDSKKLKELTKLDFIDDSETTWTPINSTED